MKDRTELILKYLDNPKLRERILNSTYSMGVYDKKWERGDREERLKHIVKRSLPSAEEMIDEIRETKPLTFQSDYNQSYDKWEFQYCLLYLKDMFKISNNDFTHGATQAWLFACFGIDSREDK